MKRRRTRRAETVTVGKRRFRVTKKRAEAVAVLLQDSEVFPGGEDEPALPVHEVFREEIARYGKSGLALRGARKKEEISQVELARKLGIGQTDVSKMENGKRPIGKRMARRLAEVLRIDYRVFL